MRNVIVTGGTRGIGLAIGRRLAASGHRVIAVARSEGAAFGKAAESVRAEAKGDLQFRRYDLGEIAGIGAFVKSLRSDFGAIYGLVNNAATGTSGMLARMQDSVIEQTLRLNTLSPIVLTKGVVRAMMVDGGGRIVNITSVVSATGFSGLSVYGATKASMVGFTRSLARELGPLNVTVNAIAPGFLESEMTSSLSREQRDRIARRSALQRLVEARDIAAAADFLLGDDAGNITGTVVTVDAGSTA
jgi:3-oxoacyl-[acyl-carrier protein] reductase